MSYPVAAVTFPTSIVGQPNGRLPDSVLRVVGFPGRTNARLHPQAVRAWRPLAAVASSRFGETLTVTSNADAYRSYAVQEVTFRSRYTIERLDGRPFKLWNGVRWYQRPATAIAAVPGTSNHGWGLAVDMCLARVNSTGATVYVGITGNAGLFSWLLANAHRFGWSWEAQSEPWHIRYVAGDATPKAVVAFENPATPLHPFPKGADDMILGLWRRDDHDALFAVYSDGHKQWIVDEHHWDGMRRLCAMNNVPATTNITDDPGLFAALGLVDGPVPPGCDRWGNKS